MSCITLQIHPLTIFDCGYAILWLRIVANSFAWNGYDAECGDDSGLSRKPIRIEPGSYPSSFSARVGKMANLLPDWNCGPTLLNETLRGNRSSNFTPSTRARKRSSQSGTRRRCNSKLASESRLIFQPRSWSFVARTSCDQPFFSRHFFTCGPTRFNADFVTWGDGIEGGGKECVHTHTIKGNPLRTENGLCTKNSIGRLRENGLFRSLNMAGIELQYRLNRSGQAPSRSPVTWPIRAAVVFAAVTSE